MRKTIKRIGAAILLAALLAVHPAGVASAQENNAAEEIVNAPSEQELYARGAVLMDASSGRILYEKNGTEKLPNASTTKIMTCILILEQGISEDESVEVSSYAASQPKVHLGMINGEHYKVKDLMYSMMLESHNDSAAALAEHFGKKYLSGDGNAAGNGNAIKNPVSEELTSEDAILLFADAMNKKAKEIGCTDTTFVTPNGLDAVRNHEAADEPDGITEIRHGTTARDLALIMAYCVKKSPARDAFLEITQTDRYSFSEEQGKRLFTCINHNAFLYMMDGVISGKTGFTAKAGYCYVAALESGESCYTLALLACGWPGNKTYKWSDAKKLFSFGLAAFDRHTLSECGEMPEPESIPVTGGQGSGIGETAYTGTAVDREIWEGLEREILLEKGQSLRMEVHLPGQLDAPVSKGTKVGEVRIFAGGELWQECPVVVTDSIDEIDQKWCIWQVVYQFLLLIRKNC